MYRFLGGEFISKKSLNTYSKSEFISIEIEKSYNIKNKHPFMIQLPYRTNRKYGIYFFGRGLETGIDTITFKNTLLSSV